MTFPGNFRIGKNDAFPYLTKRHGRPRGGERVSGDGREIASRLGVREAVRGRSRLAEHKRSVFTTRLCPGSDDSGSSPPPTS